MNWECFFETYCTLSDENNTPKGLLKEYSTKGQPLTICWRYLNERTFLEEKCTYKNVTFIEHHIEDAICRGRGPIHTLLITCGDGSEYSYEMHGDTVYERVEVYVETVE